MFLFKSILAIFIAITPAYAGVFNFIKKAETANLYNDPLWLLLLQYENGESKIDDPSFFISKEGKRDPKKELISFIKNLYKDSSIKCKFPARYYFLRKRLNLPFGSELECPEVKEFIQELKGNKLSIVFADSHINSPASMFGHTFLRIYDKEKDVSSYIINYAAVTDESFGPFYAFKGIFGFYKGYYSMAPFYIKIKEYVAMEGRDLWEYEIKIDPENLYILKLHLFEIKDTFSYYYFFQENCSTNVFYLINFTNPDERLKVDTFWVIPVDTIKVLIRKGKIRKVMYEPSSVTKLHHILSELKDGEVELIKKWAFSERRLPEKRNASFYEFAYEYVKFLYFSEKLDRDLYRKKFLEALKMLNKSKTKRGVRKYKASPPHISHDSQRFSLLYGYSKGRYIRFMYRPAYHDLLDRVQGYRPNSEIVFSELSVIYEISSENVYIDRWKIIRIVSLEPVTEVYKPVSWKVDFGLESEGQKYGAYLNTGGGYTWKIYNFSIFVLPEVYLKSNLWEARGGVNAGLLRQGNIFSLLIGGKGGYYIDEEGRGRYGNIETVFNISPSLNLAFRIGIEYLWKDGNEEMDLFTSANYYF